MRTREVTVIYESPSLAIYSERVEEVLHYEGNKLSKSLERIEAKESLDNYEMLILEVLPMQAFPPEVIPMEVIYLD